MAMKIPGVRAPDDERERRQIRATYYGAQREVDDALAQLFDFLHHSKLAESTLVVVTSDHGEMGGDHWLLEKLGYWDESYHIPLIVVDPRQEADGGRGRQVDAVTESVDILPTICEYIGADVPLQADGWSLDPIVKGLPTPEHWRETAHFEWSFSNPSNPRVENMFGIPMSHCSLVVARGRTHKYVQFAAAPEVFPPLLFDLVSDPEQVDNLCRRSSPPHSEMALHAAQELLRWHMRTAERTLSGIRLDAERGAVEARDMWR
jgi:arylsulfatase A-like enzyme